MSDIDKEQLADNTDMDINDTSLEIQSDALDEDNDNSVELDAEDVDVEADDEVEAEVTDDVAEEDTSTESDDNELDVTDEQEEVEVTEEDTSAELDDEELDLGTSEETTDEDEGLEDSDDVSNKSSDLEQDDENDLEVEVLEADETESEDVESDAVDETLANTEDEDTLEVEEELEVEVDSNLEVEEVLEDDTDADKETSVQTSLENIGDSAKKSFYALREWQQARSDLKDAKRKLETIELELSDQQSLYDMRRDVEANYEKLTSDNETKTKELQSEIEEKKALVDTLKSKLETLETEYNNNLKACEEEAQRSSSSKSRAKTNLSSMTSILKDTERRRVVSEGRLKEIKVKRANKIEALSQEIKEANRLAQKYTDNARALSVSDKARCIEVKEKAEVQKLRAERLTEELEMVTKEFDAKVAFVTKSFEDADSEFSKAKANVAKAKDEFDNVTKTHAKHEANAREITDEYEANKKGLVGEIDTASSRIDECSDEIETISSYQLQIDSIISSPEKTRALSNKVAHLKEDLEYQAGDVKILEDRFSEIEDRTTSERKIFCAVLGVILLLIILSL